MDDSADTPPQQEQQGREQQHDRRARGPQRLYREPEDEKIAGVCAGLADYTGVDPGLVRAAAIVLAVVTPFGLIGYLVAVFAVDKRPPSVPRVTAPPVEAFERYRWLPVALLVAVVVVGVDGPWWWFDAPLAALVLIGIGVWLLVRGSQSDPPGDDQAPETGPGQAPGPGAPEHGAAADPFGPSTERPQTVTHRPPRTSWSPPPDPNSLSLGVDFTTRNEEAGPRVDRTADLRGAVDDADGAETGELAPIETDRGSPAQGQTGSPPVHQGAGPPGGLPPLTPPEWSGPEVSAGARSPAGAPAGPPADPPTGAPTDPLTGPPIDPATGAPADSSGAPAEGIGSRFRRWTSQAADLSVSMAEAADDGRAPESGTRGGLGTVVLALLLVAGGSAWFVGAAGIAEVDPRAALAVGLVVVGAALVAAAWWGRARATLLPLALVAVAALVAGEVISVPLDAGVGERTVRVERRSELGEPFELLIGELVLDLREAPLSTTRPTQVTAEVGLGHLQVRVPSEANVVVHATVQAGSVAGALRAPDGGDSGLLVDETYVLDGEEGGPDLELVLEAGLGEVEVVRD